MTPPVQLPDITFFDLFYSQEWKEVILDEPVGLCYEIGTFNGGSALLKVSTGEVIWRYLNDFPHFHLNANLELFKECLEAFQASLPFYTAADWPEEPWPAVFEYPDLAAAARLQATLVAIDPTSSTEGRPEEDTVWDGVLADIGMGVRGSDAWPE